MKKLSCIDLGYFVQYNLKVLYKAFEELKTYLERKAQENAALLEYRIPGLNERQLQIVKICAEKQATIIKSKDLQIQLNVSVKTIRSDLEGLVELGLLAAVPLNKRLIGYTRAENFEERLGEIRRNFP